MAIETENTAHSQRPMEQKAPEPTNPPTNPSSLYGFVDEPRLYPGIQITSVEFPKRYAKTFVPVQTPRQVDLFAKEVTFTILHSIELKGMYPKERKWLFEKWAIVDKLMEDLEFDIDGLDEKGIDDKERRIAREKSMLGEAFAFVKASGRVMKNLEPNVRECEFQSWVRALEEERAAAKAEDEFMKLIEAEEVKRDKGFVKKSGR